MSGKHHQGNDGTTDQDGPGAEHADLEHLHVGHHQMRLDAAGQTVDDSRRCALPDAEYLAHPSIAERRARGTYLREQVPLERHARFTVSSVREDPVTILVRQGTQRIPELVPVRHGRMLTSPFAFFRGGAAIMAADVATCATSGIRAQLCGDAHLVNFGLFDSPERSLVFDLNDFDETLPGPTDWDVKRLAASIEIAGRDLGHSAAERTRAVEATVRAYREAVLTFAEMGNLEVWYQRLSVEDLVRGIDEAGEATTTKELHKRVNQSLRRNHLSAFNKLLETVDGETRFISNPPVLVPVEELLVGDARDRYVEVIQAALRQYRESLPCDRQALVEEYRFVSLARKVVGVGSVGTRCWVALFEGRDSDDPLMLQMKEAQQSVLAPYAGPTQYATEGQRVVEGQRAMQAAGDHLLGWYRIKAWDDQVRDFFIRQMWDGKSSIDVTKLSPQGLAMYGHACGWTLARAHSRTGDRVALAAYLGEDDTYDRALGEFASVYADVNEDDWQRLGQAVADGELSIIDA